MKAIMKAQAYVLKKNGNETQLMWTENVKVKINSENCEGK